MKQGPNPYEDRDAIPKRNLSVISLSLEEEGGVRVKPDGLKPPHLTSPPCRGRGNVIFGDY